MSIRTPLDSYYQIEALKSLREGLQEYDKRHGWRGAITNRTEKDWYKKNVKEFITDKSLNWKLAKVIHLDKLSAKIENKILLFNKQIAEKNFWKNKLSAQNILKEKKFLENITSSFSNTENELENLEELIELATKENDTIVLKDCEKKNKTII